MSLKFNPFTGNFDLVGGSDKWKDPVATSASLPSSGNSAGDVRIALDSKILYEWDGASWTGITSGVATSVSVDSFTLSALNASNKYVVLSAVPSTASKTILLIKEAPSQFYGDDFVITADDGGKRLSWNGLDLDGVLEETDKLTVLYTS